MKSFTPKCVHDAATFELMGYAVVGSTDNPLFSEVAAVLNYLLETGWDFYVVAQQRGRCYFNEKVITIPLWALGHKDKEYWAYYLSHEMAHAMAGKAANHGPSFMPKFKSICPSHLQHYEFEYKATAAIAAGVQPGSDF